MGIAIAVILSVTSGSNMVDLCRPVAPLEMAQHTKLTWASSGRYIPPFADTDAAHAQTRYAAGGSANMLADAIAAIKQHQEMQQLCALGIRARIEQARRARDLSAI